MNKQDLKNIMDIKQREDLRPKVPIEADSPSFNIEFYAPITPAELQAIFEKNGFPDVKILECETPGPETGKKVTSKTIFAVRFYQHVTTEQVREMLKNYTIKDVLYQKYLDL